MVTRRAVLRRFPGVPDVFPGLSRGLLNIAFQFPGRPARDLAHGLVKLALHLLSNAFDLVLVHDVFLQVCDRRRVTRLRQKQYRKSGAFVKQRARTNQVARFAYGKSPGTRRPGASARDMHPAAAGRLKQYDVPGALDKRDARQPLPSRGVPPSPTQRLRCSADATNSELRGNLF
jgi:hypothetical protein